MKPFTSTRRRRGHAEIGERQDYRIANSPEIHFIPRNNDAQKCGSYDDDCRVTHGSGGSSGRIEHLGEGSMQFIKSGVNT
jgi:hypothetical protein